jgi:hypothetical protein
MKKVILSMFMLLTLVLPAMANEIQLFTSNTMHIELDSNTKIEKVFFGESEDFYKQYKDIMQTDMVQKAAFHGALSATAVAASRGTFKNLNSNNGLAGVAAIAAFTVGKITYDWATSDNEYVLVTIATNSAGEKTMLQTMLVTNYSVDLEEGEKLAMANQLKLITK